MRRHVEAHPQVARRAAADARAAAPRDADAAAVADAGRDAHVERLLLQLAVRALAREAQAVGAAAQRVQQIQLEIGDEIGAAHA